MGKSLKEERLGATNYNNQGELMKVVEYNTINDITVEFQDGTQVKTSWARFMSGCRKNPNRLIHRLGAEKVNSQGYLMKLIEWHNSENIVVEFQDKYKCKVQSSWSQFQSALIHNPYHPNKFGGILGDKYSTVHNGKTDKEYHAWKGILERCYDDVTKEKNPTYRDAICCEEWLYYPNFYEWMHKQENFEVWKHLSRSAIDKDILIKGNKVYSPNTCCLVSERVNKLFPNAHNIRGNLPIGVTCKKSQSIKPYTAYMYRNNKHYFLGNYKTSEEAFQVYKQHKEAYIKQVAQEEYSKGTISKKCYKAMMRWEVEITD
jgi:hypothetical protein